MNSLPVLLQRFQPAAKAAVVRSLLLLSCLLAPTSAFAAFGYTDTGTSYAVDTGGGLVYEVRKTDGSIISIVFNGTEYRSATAGRYSQIASGLGSATTVTPETDGSTYVKMTIQTDPANGVVSNLTHYLISRPGDTTIYMATHTTAEPGVGELRWITRLNSALIPDGPGPSDNTGTTGAIESSDVFGKPDGTTRSKYYGDTITHGKDRAMDLTFCGATGPGIGCWMVFGSRESSSGGPFFRDIQNQNGGDQEIYNYMNSGHNQTEPYRVNNVLHGPYALVFTTGAPPTLPVDYSWMGSLGLTGWVPTSGRGAVSGTAAGIPAGFQGVVGFANSDAQYWATVSGGTYACPGMKPGTYAATLYKGELAVATDTATITTGATSTLNLASTEAAPSTIFRIGEWDGTPAGLLNADKIVQMHPQDVRMSPWNTTTFTVGVDDPGIFPAIQFRGANSPTTVRFNLAPNQLVDLTLKIGLTCAYNNGRPQVTVNSFTSAAPAASSQPSSRSFTIGTYRGNNALFAYTIPASALVAGTNTLTINPISGSTDLGTWLSAGWVYDAVELDGPIATPVISYVGSSPLIISGTAEPGRNITVTLDGSTPAGGTAVSPDGTWSVTYGAPLPAGAHAFTAVAGDDAGHSSPVSAAYVINTGVTQPAITAAVGDTGTYASGASTSDRVFTFNGTAGAGDTVTLTRLGTGGIGSITANGSGNWTFDYSSVSLPDGANSFYATASNGGGSSASSAVFTLNLAGAPRIAIVRFDPPTATVTGALAGVVFRVTFNHPVSGVTPGAFAVTTTNTAAGSVAGVSAAAGSVFDVTVGSLSGTGSLRLDLKPASGVVDGANNPEAGYTAGESYSLVLPTTGNGTWIQPDTGGLWSDAANWQGAVIADGAGNSANFNTLDLTAGNTVHLDSARTLASATFGDTAAASSASWILDHNGVAGNTLTLAGATPVITVNALGAGASTTIGTSLAGTAGLTKAGAGTLVLAAANPLTGVLNVSAGFLQLAPGGSLNLGNSAVNTALNTQLNVAGGSFATTGLVSAATSSVVINSGTAAIGSFRTNSDFGASLRVNGGTLTVGDVNIRRNSGAPVDFNSGFIVTGTGVATATTIGLGTQNSTGAMSVEGGGSLTVSGVVTIANQASSARGGAMRVLNNATFTSTDTALGILLCRNNGANVNNVGSATFTGGVSTVEKFTLGFDAAVTAGSATITLNGGTLYLGSGGIVKNGAAGLATNLNFSSGTLGAKAGWSTALNVNLPNNGNVTIKAADAADAPFDIALNGVVGGAGGFTKTGAGTLTLDGAAAHTYTGATNVNAGALRLTGSLAAAANGVAINNGGTLTGNGIVNRPVTLNAGGTIAPDGAGALATLGGTSITWNAGGRLLVDLDAGGPSDQLALSGTLTKGAAGSYEVAIDPGSSYAAGSTYTLATFGATTFAAGDFVATGLPAGYAASFTLGGTSLQLTIIGTPEITSAGSASGTYGAPFNYAITAANAPTSFSATGLPAGLVVDPVTGVISGVPAQTGTFNVILGATNLAGTGTAPLALTVVKAPAGVTLGNLAATYDGTPHAASATTAPAGLGVAFTYDGSGTAPTNAGSYAVAATIVDANYFGGATGTLVIGKGAATVTLGGLSQIYDGSPKSATAATVPAGLNVDFTYNGSATPPTAAGSYAVVATVNDANYAGTASGTLVIAKAAATIELAPLTQRYDGTEKPVTATTTPAGLTVNLTYDGVTDAPVYPGPHTVVATIDDANYEGTKTGTLTLTITALVRHAPTLNGIIDGSVQMLTAESLTFNGSSSLSGDVLVPGSPALRLNGHPMLLGTKDGPGAAAPANHTVTLNGNALVRYLVRRVDPIALPTVAAPPAPAGTRNVILNRSTDPVGDFATLRNLTLNGNAGTVVVPPGTYGNFTANGSSAFVLGVAGAGEPAVYNLQNLTLNGNTQLLIAGPVRLTFANGITVSGDVGNAAHPEWLTLRFASGGVTLNGNAEMHGEIVAPNGTVIINGNSHLVGSVSCDRLTINGNAVLDDLFQ